MQEARPSVRAASGILPLCHQTLSTHSNRTNPISDDIMWSGLRDGRGGAEGEAGLARYLWLPVAGPKRDRTALRARLPAALAFVSGHLARGRRVLVLCDDGVALALHLSLAMDACAA